MTLLHMAKLCSDIRADDDCCVQPLESMLQSFILATIGGSNAVLGETFALCMLCEHSSTAQASSSGNLLPLLVNAIGVADPALSKRSLAILHKVSVQSPKLLLHHAASMRSLLALLHELDDQQLHIACDCLANVAVEEGLLSEEVDAEAFPFAAAMQQAYSAALASGDVLHMRAAMTGYLTWQLALAKAGADQAEHAKNMLETLLGRVSRRPVQLAFLCQRMAVMLREIRVSAVPLGKVSYESCLQ